MPRISSKPLGKEWLDRPLWAQHRLNVLPLSFPIFTQQWLATLIPDAWATPANGKGTSIHRTQLFFVAHRTNWPGRWFQWLYWHVVFSDFTVASAFANLKSEQTSLSLECLWIKAAHVLSANFITLLKSLTEIARAPFYFLCSNSAEEVPAMRSWRGSAADLHRKYLQALQSVASPQSIASAGPSWVCHVLRTGSR